MITKPTLLIDEKRCRQNIKTMVSKILGNKVDFRPHFKTHQSLEIGQWFKEEGVDKITVSSLEMAEYFSGEWNDITLAFPVNILEIETINRLAERITLNVLVESIDAVRFLTERLTDKIGFFVKIDVGYNRTGIKPSNTILIDRILDMADPCETLRFKGFLAHAGHTYNCRNREEIIGIHKKSVDQLTRLKTGYMKRYPDIIVSSGDTPSCSVIDDFTGIDELRPGNFVFYDLTQYRIGACDIRQIAVAMVCPIVAVHKDRNELLIYGGGVHFSKESLNHETLGPVFGRVVEKKDGEWGDIVPGAYLKSLSQEHGVVAVLNSDISKYKTGDLLGVLPVHSCMTANLMKAYETPDSRRIERI